MVVSDLQCDKAKHFAIGRGKTFEGKNKVNFTFFVFKNYPSFCGENSILSVNLGFLEETPKPTKPPKL